MKSKFNETYNMIMEELNWKERLDINVSRPLKKAGTIAGLGAGAVTGGAFTGPAGAIIGGLIGGTIGLGIDTARSIAQLFKKVELPPDVEDRYRELIAKTKDESITKAEQKELAKIYKDYAK